MSSFTSHQRKFWSAAQKISSIKYSLQACRNLAAHFIGVGDKESVQHFEQRQRELGRELKQLEAA